MTAALRHAGQAGRVEVAMSESGMPCDTPALAASCTPTVDQLLVLRFIAVLLLLCCAVTIDAACWTSSTSVRWRTCWPRAVALASPPMTC